MNRARLAAAVMGMLATGALVAACGGGETTDPSPSATSATRTHTRTASTATAEASTPTLAAATQTPGAGPSATPAAIATPVTEATPRPQPTQPPLPPPTVPAGVTLTVAAINTTFAPTRLSAPGGATLTVTLDNQDAAILHNFVLFNSSGDQLAETELFEGPGARSVTFPAPGPGSYPFTCTVHPREMRGTLTVQ